MAKKTKSSNLSLEERLEQALIPNWDEPYKLPSNWCLVKLSAVCSLENGEKSTEKGLVYLDAKTLRGITEPQTRDSGIVINKNQKVILVDGENSGEVFVVPYRGYMGSTFKIINITTNVDEMYIRYFIEQNREKLRNNKVGSAIPHLNKELFFNLQLPFPPLNEQKRIVSHFEVLFAKLNEAKEKAQEVVDGFESRKAAILHRAFSGELTAKWRKSQEVVQTWAYVELQQITVKIGDGLHGTPTYTPNTDYYFINGNNLSGHSIEIKPDTKTVDRTEYEKNYIELDDQTVLLSINGTLGNTAFYAGEKVILGKSACYIMVQKDVLDKYYLRYYLTSKEFCNFAYANATGSTIKNLGLKQIRQHKIPLPSIEEQREIVSILNSIITKETNAKETAEAVIEQIDTMKKAILTRAFRGELGTNDPSEESATKLIKQILEEKIKEEDIKQKRTPKKRVEVTFVAKTILEVLKSSEKLTPEKLKAETALEIDDFYDQLKALIDSGQIRETRIDGESYLEAVQ